jgi:hypothetical protein
LLTAFLALLLRLPPASLLGVLLLVLLLLLSLIWVLLLLVLVHMLVRMRRVLTVLIHGTWLVLVLHVLLLHH